MYYYSSFQLTKLLNIIFLFYNLWTWSLRAHTGPPPLIKYLLKSYRKPLFPILFGEPKAAFINRGPRVWMLSASVYGSYKINADLLLGLITTRIFFFMKILRIKYPEDIQLLQQFPFLFCFLIYFNFNFFFFFLS